MDPLFPALAAAEFPIVITPGATPPINAVITVRRYLAWRGFGPLPKDGIIRSNLVIYIEDDRVAQNINYRNNLYFLDPTLYPVLPRAYDHDQGRITFFAHTPDFAGVMTLLATGHMIWLQTHGGQVSLMTNGRTIA